MVVSLDLLHVAVLVIVLAADAIGTLSCLKEGFTVFVLLCERKLWKYHLTVAVRELARIAIAAKADFNPVFAQLCFVFSLKFGDHVTAVGHLGCFSGSISCVDFFGWSFSRNKGCCRCVECDH